MLRNLNIIKPVGEKYSINVNAPNATVVLENVLVDGILVNDVYKSTLIFKGSTNVVGEFKVSDKSNDAHIIVDEGAKISGQTIIESGAELEVKNSKDQKPFGSIMVNLKEESKSSKVAFKGDFKTSPIVIASEATIELNSENVSKNIEARANIELLSSNKDIIVKALQDIKKTGDIKLKISDKVDEKTKKELETNDTVILNNLVNTARVDFSINESDGKEYLIFSCAEDKFKEGTTVQLVADKPQYIKLEPFIKSGSFLGTLIRPTDGSDVEVILTATFTKGNSKTEKQFKVTIKGEKITALEVVDESNCELEEGLLGAYYITVRLKEGFDYSNYTAKIKDSNEALIYDADVKALFYENAYGNMPDSITIVITEKTTGKTQEVNVKAKSQELLQVVDFENSRIEQPLLGTYSVVVALKQGISYEKYTAKIKGADVSLIYDEAVGTFFYNSYDGTVPEELTIIITETSTNRVEEVIIKLS